MTIKTYLQQKVETVKRWYQRTEFITWSRLATFGNNPLVKLTILTPLVAQFLIHKDTITFLARYDFKNIEYMYASLMCFFFAQLIYMFRCERDIKDYPSEVRYTQALDATTSDEDLNISLFDEYKVFFKKYGGEIEDDEFDFEPLRYKIILQANLNFGSMPPESTVEEANRDAMMFDEFKKVISMIKNGCQEQTIDWNLIRHSKYPTLETIYRAAFENNRDWSFDKVLPVQELSDWIDTSVNSSHWRAKALKRRYDKLNTSNLLSRSIAAVLYCLGALYFLYTGVMNIYRVLDTYGWITVSQNSGLG